MTDLPDKETLHDHFVKCDFDGRAYMNLICKAPNEALCHATYSCNCETWAKEWVEDGTPKHETDFEWGDNEVHTGEFVNACNLEEWFSADCGESLQGQILFPVSSTWEGDHVEFQVALVYPENKETEQ